VQHMVATGDPGRAVKPLIDLPSPSEASMTRSAGAVLARAMLNLLVPAQISLPEGLFDQIETQELGVAALFETGLKPMIGLGTSGSKVSVQREILLSLAFDGGSNPAVIEVVTSWDPVCG
jgi:hypothetical protein